MKNEEQRTVFHTALAYVTALRVLVALCIVGRQYQSNKMSQVLTGCSLIDVWADENISRTLVYVYVL